jgi:hypothetical protein
MKQTLKKLLQNLGLLESWYFTKATVLFVYGAIVFWITGRTPLPSHQAMIYFFCRSKGRFNDRISRIISWVNPVGNLEAKSGVLGLVTPERLGVITEALDRDGFYIFKDHYLDGRACDELLQIALNSPIVAREAGGKKITTFNREKPETIRYDIHPTQLLKHEVVQNLISDPSLELVARSYLRTNPVIDIVTMWWNTAFSALPSKEAAQFYHFDMDRFKWLKFFFYVTDVGPDQGPHSFVAGTHRSGVMPKSIMDKGYVRLDDAEVMSSFPANAFQEFTGRRGYILAEDTRGLHKGKNVKSGDRLVFQLQYSNSMMGSLYLKTPIPEIKSRRLRDLIAHNTTLLRNYLPL